MPVLVEELWSTGQRDRPRNGGAANPLIQRGQRPPGHPASPITSSTNEAPGAFTQIDLDPLARAEHTNPPLIKTRRLEYDGVVDRTGEFSRRWRHHGLCGGKNGKNSNSFGKSEHLEYLLDTANWHSASPAASFKRRRQFACARVLRPYGSTPCSRLPPSQGISQRNRAPRNSTGSGRMTRCGPSFKWWMHGSARPHHNRASPFTMGAST
ncbi:hypothetical protein C7455_10229 [Roseicyclus mahoneyensis]|uniref:Uncharacterized protein n=1 Tax=Roseicyclus mahoneyensis TaxID=164332 RepID=A0A316GPD2_9RHOB|nr:hypothetical protein C7455_10229 [Roseicyclus mahoneyensis]